MSRMALYREFRPQSFADVVGQEHVTRTLRNAISQNRVHHAYLLSGPRGTGKTTLARILAKAINCLQPEHGEPCNVCKACLNINDGQTMDIIEIDAASNRNIDDIRDLRDKVKYGPADLKRKVYIIDEVHMLTDQAFNALLKTLEEPPSHALFILATTDPQKVPVTIASRCQRFEMHRLSMPEIVGRLAHVCQKYSIGAEPEALTVIARQADGAMRDALSLLDQIMAFADDQQGITLADALAVLGAAPLDQFLRLDEAIRLGKVGEALLVLDELARQGKDLRQLTRDYLAHWRDLLLVRLDPNGEILGLTGPSLDQLKQQGSAFTQPQILGIIRVLSRLEADLRTSVSPRLLVEVTLIQLCAEVAVGPADEQPAPVAHTISVPSKAQGEPRSATASHAMPTSMPDAWKAVVEQVRRIRPSTCSILGHFHPKGIEAETLIIIGANESFVNLINRQTDLDAIAQAMAKVGFSGARQVRAEKG